jgi:hypothetical protein
VLDESLEEFILLLPARVEPVLGVGHHLLTRATAV